jgi:hypothetical protein
VTESLSGIQVLGVGAVTPAGRDLRVIAEKLNQKLTEKLTEKPAGKLTEKTTAKLTEPAHVSGDILRVDDALLTHPAAAVQLRRADRFIRMAVVAAVDAWAAAAPACVGIKPERIGLILSSGFGPHCRGFKFLDGILDAGDTAASPTDFSHSVHGSAAAYISRLLDIRGPSLSITDFETGFEEAVKIAQCWLNENACDRVLIGAAEELGQVYLDCSAKMLRGRTLSPGEGAVFMVAGPRDMPGLARVDAVSTPAEVDLLIVEDPPLFLPAGVSAPVKGRRTISFTGVFGHSASNSAFNLLGGLLAMRDGIDTAATLRTSSEGRSVTLSLRSREGS